jgi:autophagy-related protein 5
VLIVQDDCISFNAINHKLLNPPSPLRNIPLRIYIPSGPDISGALGSFKVVQSLVPPRTSNRKWQTSIPHRVVPADGVSGEVQTLGSALHSMLPLLFPSRRDAILAEPILHGAPLPFRAPLEDIMREAAYADGWIYLTVIMLN